MSDKESMRYIVLFQMYNADAQRLGRIVPRIVEMLQRISSTGTEQFFRSVHGDVFAYFVRSTMNAAQVAAAIESPGPAYGTRVLPILDGNDKVTVIEIGPDFSGRGIGRAAVWLQRH